MATIETVQYCNKGFAEPELAEPSPSSPARVLFVNHTGTPGGAEIAMLNLIRHLDPAKIKASVVFGADGPMVEQMRQVADTYVLSLPVAVGGAKKDAMGLASVLKLQPMFLAIGYIWRLARFMRKNNPDFIHTNSLKAHLLGGFAAMLARKRVVWHLRNSVDRDYLPSSMVRLMFRFLARRMPDFVITCSGATMRSLSPRSSARNCESANANSRVAIVHDGTVPSCESGKSSARDGSHRIALIGRISPWKGQHIFIRAAAMVRERFPKAQFFIVGASLFGEEDYERKVRALAKDYGGPDLITFTGFRKDVLNVIADMDVIVHASTIGEPFGQVIIEGMAAGKPVIATDGGGVPEIVENGKTGILVPMGHEAAMAEAITRVLGDPALAAEMGLLGRERVQNYFMIDHTARKIEAVYAMLQSSPRWKTKRRTGHPRPLRHPDAMVTATPAQERRIS